MATSLSEVFAEVSFKTMRGARRRLFAWPKARRLAASFEVAENRLVVDRPRAREGVPGALVTF